MQIQKGVLTLKSIDSKTKTKQQQNHSAFWTAVAQSPAALSTYRRSIFSCRLNSDVLRDPGTRCVQATDPLNVCSPPFCEAFSKEFGEYFFKDVKQPAYTYEMKNGINSNTREEGEYNFIQRLWTGFLALANQQADVSPLYMNRSCTQARQVNLHWNRYTVSLQKDTFELIPQKQSSV